MTRPLEPLAGAFSRGTVNRVKHRIGQAVAWNLDALGILWGTDKARGHHGYTTYYARHLGPRRRSIRCVLEIGIGGDSDPDDGGHSLRMWHNYFPRATVYGIDRFEKRLADEPRIVALQADQSDADSLRRAVSGCPPFDLIVDDGSHVAQHIITSFEVLFSALLPGGLYAIEDLQTAYEADHGGGPPGSPGTAVALAKDLIDDLNLGTRPVAAVHTYPKLVLIEKAGG